MIFYKILEWRDFGGRGIVGLLRRPSIRSSRALLNLLNVSSICPCRGRGGGMNGIFFNGAIAHRWTGMADKSQSLISRVQQIRPKIGTPQFRVVIMSLSEREGEFA
jgi:hypothetical protein